MILHLEQVLARNPSGTVRHQFAKAKLSAVRGDVAAASASLNELLLTVGEGLPDDHFIFTNILHIALLALELDTAAEAMNRRFRTGSWFRIVYEDRPPELLTVVSWRVSGTRAVFALSNELRTSSRFDFVITRLISVLPICAACHQRNGVGPGEIQINMDDYGILPGLAFCDSRPEMFLIPDPPYLLSRAYAEIRRHYEQHPIEWNDTKPVAFWRGSTTGRLADPALGWRSLPRIRLCELGRQHNDIIDAGISQLVQLSNKDEKEARASGLMTNFVPATNFNMFRYQIDIDGNTNSWPGLFQKLLTGSPVLKVASPGGYRQWYYDRLAPWLNYVPVQTDMSDLLEKIEWLRAHDEKAREIGERGRTLAESLDYETEVQNAVGVVIAAFWRSAPLP